MADVDLDKIVEELDPDKVNAKIGKKHSKAHITYKSEKIEVADWEEFRKEIINYVKHHHKHIYNADINDERAYQIALETLSREENQGGFGDIKSAYSIARGGKLQDVVRAIARGMETNDRSAYNTHVLHQIDPMDFETHTKLMEKFIEKYKGILPKDIKEKKPEELAKDYESLIQLLAGHAYAMRDKLKAYEPKKAAK